MTLPYSDELNIGAFQQIFSDVSESYKFFWLRSIIKFVNEGQIRMKYDDIINSMLADVWYMVNEYHLDLGPRDQIKETVKHMSDISGFQSNEKESVLISYLKEEKDRELRRKKRDLTVYVPYYLLSSFLPGSKGSFYNGKSNKRIADDLNHLEGMLYSFEEIKGLNSFIVVDSLWAEYIRKNYGIIYGWIEYQLVLYLQKRNPSVPGISNKLHCPIERNMNNVIKYWKMVSEVTEIKEIYGNKLITKKDISIDHFVPWSYVTHDELWNLHPTTKSINSSKSNNLPDWNVYFEKLCELEYKGLVVAHQYEKVQKELENCIKFNLNDENIKYKLFEKKNISQKEFTYELEQIIKPVYLSAQNLGFKGWTYNDNTGLL